MNSEDLLQRPDDELPYHEVLQLDEASQRLLEMTLLIRKVSKILKLLAL